MAKKQEQKRPNIMGEIEALFKAREDYARVGYIGKLKKQLTHTDVPAAVAQVKDLIEELFPDRANLDGSPFRDKVDAIAADPEIGNADVDLTYSTYVRAMKGRLGLIVGDTKTAYSQLCNELTAAANPFNHEKFDAAQTRYSQELLLLGGLPDSKTGIASVARQAVVSGDIGALAFWAKNFFKAWSQGSTGEHATFGRTRPTAARESEEMSEVEAEIARQSAKFKSSLHNNAAANLAALKASWAGANMDDTLKSAAYIARQNDTAGLPEPRSRTTDEISEANRAQKIRDAKAVLAEATAETNATA